MPTANSPRTPKAWEPAYAKYAENDAWLTGDTKTLQKLHSGGSGQATHMYSGTPHRGGLAGVASSMIWGRPVPGGQQRIRFHVPIAADLATLASDVQYSTPTETTFAGDEKGDQKAQQRLDDLMNSDETHAMFNAQGEITYALGATAIIHR